LNQLAKVRFTLLNIAILVTLSLFLCVCVVWEGSGFEPILLTQSLILAGQVLYHTASPFFGGEVLKFEYRASLLKPFSQPFLLLVIFQVLNFFPWADWDHDPPTSDLPHSWDYKYKSAQAAC
jgi:hypothetical protein